MTQIQEDKAALVGQSREQADLVHGAKQKMDWMQDEIYRLEVVKTPECSSREY